LPRHLVDHAEIIRVLSSGGFGSTYAVPMDSVTTMPHVAPSWKGKHLRLD
jgi:hypothetical protein